ncbi:unnamed protein product [Spodoptera exigua]|nr:unnamed protein product [Spodoptera exigua]
MTHSPCKSSSSQQEALEISAGTAILSRIPEFWRDQPRLWFKQLEAIVAPQKQGDDYKYYTVIAKLPKEEIIQVSDLITCPPPIEKYKAIKERLISCYEESDQRQLQKLLSEMDLGDQKPSHLLRKMRTLSNGNISDETIKLLWLRLLPPSVTSVLAVTEDIDVNKMSQIADKILINSTRTEVSAVNGNKSGDDTMSCILAQLAEMQLELNAIQQGKSHFLPVQINVMVISTCDVIRHRPPVNADITLRGVLRGVRARRGVACAGGERGARPASDMRARDAAHLALLLLAHLVPPGEFFTT